MRLVAVEIYSFELPLVRPLLIKGEPLSTRRGVLLEFRDDAGHAGYGEISPLPGLHRESLEQVLGQLRELATNLSGTEIPDDALTLSGAFAEWLDAYDLAPTVRYGVEMAALHLLAAQRKRPLYELLGTSPHRIVPVNALLSGTTDEMIAAAQSRAREGYRTLKIKVGRLAPKTEVAAIRRIRRLLGNEIKLRLDANRSWELEEAVCIGRELLPLDIEYIEEPVKDPHLLSEFFRRTGVPIAMDESVAEPEFNAAKVPQGTRAVILKPSLVGGIERSVGLIRALGTSGVVPILSCAFYSGLGLSVLAQLAAAFAPPDVAMGLDTFRWLKEDLLKSPFRTVEGRIDAAEVFASSSRIYLKRLKKVSFRDESS